MTVPTCTGGSDEGTVQKYSTGIYLYCTLLYYIYLYLGYLGSKCVEVPRHLYLSIQGRLQDFSQGGARFLGKKNLENRNQKCFLRTSRANVTRYARKLSRFAREFLVPVFKIFCS